MKAARGQAEEPPAARHRGQSRVPRPCSACNFHVDACIFSFLIHHKIYLRTHLRQEGGCKFRLCALAAMRDGRPVRAMRHDAPERDDIRQRMRRLADRFRPANARRSRRPGTSDRGRTARSGGWSAAGKLVLDDPLGATRAPARPASRGCWPMRSGCASCRYPPVFSGVADLKKRVRRSRRRCASAGTAHPAVRGRDPPLQPRAAGRLPAYVEDGTITLVGATTENPSFELNAALL